MKSNKLKLGFVQFELAHLDPEKSKIELLGQIAKIMSHKIDLIMLPEMCLGTAVEKNQQGWFMLQYNSLLTQLKALSAGRQVAFYGSALTKSQKKYFNTAFLIDSGRVCNTYNKLHLFRFNNEHKSFGAGTKIKIFNTRWGKVAPLICYDVRFPELLRAQVFCGATVALVCAQWPKVRREHWLTLLKARAIENQIFVIAVNRTGQSCPQGAQKNIFGQKKLEFAGDSCVISPWGEMVYHLGNNAKIGRVAIDLNQVDTVRQRFHFLKDAFRKCFEFDL